MSTVPSKTAVIKLYKELLRAGQQFPQYNYKKFAQRRIRDYFEANKNETDPVKIQELYKFGTDQLIVIKRQATISQLLPQRKLVIEEEVAKKQH